MNPAPLSPGKNCRAVSIRVERRIPLRLAAGTIGIPHFADFVRDEESGLLPRVVRLVAILAFAMLIASCQKQNESLSLLVWEGYACLLYTSDAADE